MHAAEREKRLQAKRFRLAASTPDPAKIIQYLPEAVILDTEYMPSHRWEDGTNGKRCAAQSMLTWRLRRCGGCCWSRQLVVSTQDGHLSFWDVDTVHGRIEFADKILYDTAQAGATHGDAQAVCLAL